MTYAITRNGETTFIEADNLDHACELAGPAYCVIQTKENYDSKHGCAPLLGAMLSF